MQIDPLTQANATTIANDWHYPGAYAFYDMTADPGDYAELLSAQQRGDRYYQVVTATGHLFGFFVIDPTEEAGVVEVGLGMVPAHTGRGQGEKFVREVLSFVRERDAPREIILDVAAFNQRAQIVYQRLGFRVVREHSQATNGAVFPFVEMRWRAADH